MNNMLIGINDILKLDYIDASRCRYDQGGQKSGI